MALTGVGPTGWFTELMVQLAAPVEPVVFEQVCAELPLPRVNVTDWPDRAEPPLVRFPESVIG